jgi:hypothetical protein
LFILPTRPSKVCPSTKDESNALVPIKRVVAVVVARVVAPVATRELSVEVPDTVRAVAVVVAKVDVPVTDRA